MKSLRCILIFSLFAVALSQSPTDIVEKFSQIGRNYSAAPYVNLGGTAYYFETVYKLNWHASFEACRRLGLFLVAIETAEEDGLLGDYILGSDISLDYWTSGSEYTEEGSYFWMSTGERIRYFNWAPSAPDHFGTGDDHARAIYLFGPLNQKWEDASPFQTMHFICEQMLL